MSVITAAPTTATSYEQHCTDNCVLITLSFVITPLLCLWFPDLGSLENIWQTCFLFPILILNYFALFNLVLKLSAVSLSFYNQDFEFSLANEEFTEFHLMDSYRYFLTETYGGYSSSFSLPLLILPHLRYHTSKDGPREPCFKWEF